MTPLNSKLFAVLDARRGLASTRFVGNPLRSFVRPHPPLRGTLSLGRGKRARERGVVRPKAHMSRKVKVLSGQTFIDQSLP